MAQAEVVDQVVRKDVLHPVERKRAIKYMKTLETATDDYKLAEKGYYNVLEICGHQIRIRNIRL